MSLEERLDSDLKDAMRSSDNVRKLAIRAVKSAIAEARVAGVEQHILSEDDVLNIVIKQVKQRRDSIAEFEKAGRVDLIEKERAEISVLEKYLPQQMNEEGIRAHARKVIAELGVSGMKALGPVMRRMSADLRGQADGQVVNRVVRELLG